MRGGICVCIDVVVCMQRSDKPRRHGCRKKYCDQCLMKFYKEKPPPLRQDPNRFSHPPLLRVRVFVCLCMHMYVCMYVCMYVYVCVCVCLRVRMCVCISCMWIYMLFVLCCNAPISLAHSRIPPPSLLPLSVPLSLSRFPSNWPCPACRRICTCAACRRQKAKLQQRADPLTMSPATSLACGLVYFKDLLKFKLGDPAGPMK